MPYPSSISNSRSLPGLIAPFITAALLFSSPTACRRSDPSLSGTFTERFDGPHLSEMWFDTIGRYTVIKGELSINAGYNHPLWLKKRLPVNVDIEFDARSLSKEGDIKVELFGDGHSFALNKGQYVATGYVLCMGGWSNTKTFIARRAEHAKNLLFTKKFKVVIGKRHHWKIESRKQKGALIINWYIDGTLALSMRDRNPLYGKSNQWFAFSNWATDVWFDNLTITPREATP